jgi:xylan 1,4-beta-xylosidase
MRGFILAAALAVSAAHAGDGVLFKWFEYSGHDSEYSAPLPAGSFHNPILAGYYPDPAITRAGDKYYLVNSTFTHWPLIPIHESTDLVHWKLIGHALRDPTKVTFDGLETSRGVFAPAIAYHDGTFYIVNTLIGAGGNFVVTAKNPAGPWSDPKFLPNVDGIDPSLLFDSDGKAYLVHNGPPEGKPLYDGHTAIWLHEFDPATLTAGPKQLLVNGGTDISRKPVWIEGPHLYHINGWYYLMCAEGGTERNHSEVIFRSKSPAGPFEPYAGNPILTQRDLPADRTNPVTNAGHADLVQMKDGSWWAVFLASQPYAGYLFNTGRETFLLPVSFKDGWPVILEHGKPIPTTLAAPKATKHGAKGDALSGNFTQREEFRKQLGPEWIQVHVPKKTWYTLLADGGLMMGYEKANLTDKVNPSFLARRQQHKNFEASTELRTPIKGVAAGLAAFQNEKSWYFLGVRRMSFGAMIFLERDAGSAPELVKQALLTTDGKGDTIKLRIRGDGGHYSFDYDGGGGWTPLVENDDATILSSEKAGGFVGTVLGPFTRQEFELP